MSFTAHADTVSSGDPFADANGKAQTEINSGDYSDGLVDYLKAINLAVSPADSAATRMSLFTVITNHGLPSMLTPSQIVDIKAQTGTVTVLDEPNSVELVQIDGQGLNSLDNIYDPQNHFPYPAILGVYMPDPNVPGKLILDCDIHYQTTDDQDFALRCGRLLALLRMTLETKTAQLPDHNGPFDVWLSRSQSSMPGGEEWHNNVYFYNIGDDRSSIEWIREIAHEYSHLAFPPLGGDYTKPEAWANGYSGEQLLLRWLNDPGVAGEKVVETAWGRSFAGYANFKSASIDPDIALYKAKGLSSVWLNRRDSMGMNYVIGLLMTVDDLKGSQAVGTLLWNMATPDPGTLLTPCKALGLHALPKHRAVTLN